MYTHAHTHIDINTNTPHHQITIAKIVQPISFLRVGSTLALCGKSTNQKNACSHSGVHLGVALRSKPRRQQQLQRGLISLDD